ncbi:hypothetical protein GALL_200800 [mine drainage metagenome]|uniref:Pilus formation protein N-terminal domain-containing protein n=1 Tax=mine drainage metagenome TaxID=410659 RepID=A0A1J5RQK5_9ZZZZ
MKPSCFAAALLAALSLAPAARASGMISVPLAGARLLTVPGQPAQVVVGDPAVADVTVQSRHRLVLFGRHVGGTTLMVLDRQGRLLLRANVMVAAADDGGVVIHYGSGGKSWVPGGLTAVAECGPGGCGPAVPVDPQPPAKAK